MDYYKKVTDTEADALVEEYKKLYSIKIDESGETVYWEKVKNSAKAEIAIRRVLKDEDAKGFTTNLLRITSKKLLNTINIVNDHKTNDCFLQNSKIEVGNCLKIIINNCLLLFRAIFFFVPIILNFPSLIMIKINFQQGINF